jgi:hypothetical protein
MEQKISNQNARNVKAFDFEVTTTVIAITIAVALHLSRS